MDFHGEPPAAAVTMELLRDDPRRRLHGECAPNHWRRAGRTAYIGVIEQGLEPAPDPVAGFAGVEWINGRIHRNAGVNTRAPTGAVAMA